jgi:transposase
VAQSLLGDKEYQVVSSDRFKSHDWLPAYWRQICWSHLRRDFQAMIDCGGAGEAIGRRLLGLSDRLFELWHRVRDGTLEENVFREQILRLRPRVRRALQDGSRRASTLMAGTCTEILRVEEGLWNFVWFPGVEPTNNAAERALRHAVIWRRISGGKPLGKATRSPRSSR